MVRNYKRKTEDRWSKEDLLEALTNIKEAKLKINDAARQYRISRATLYRQFKKFLQAGGKCDVNQFRTCGGNPILTKVEEDVLEKTIRDLREQGFTVTSSDIKRICFEYCDSNGIPNQFNQEKRMASDDWYYGFLKRHPDIRIGDGTTLVEATPPKPKKRKKLEIKEATSPKPKKKKKLDIKEEAPPRPKKKKKLEIKEEPDPDLESGSGDASGDGEVEDFEGDEPEGGSESEEIEAEPQEDEEEQEGGSESEEIEAEAEPQEDEEEQEEEDEDEEEHEQEEDEEDEDDE